jgi:voltage-gated potassium channel
MASTTRATVANWLDVGDAGISRVIDLFLITLISLNVVAIILESVTTYANAFDAELRVFELISVAVFSVEYVARVWSAPDLAGGRFSDDWRGRARYMLTPAAIIDLLAIAPFYLSMLFTIDLRFLRVVRLFRIFKLTRYSSTMSMIFTVFREETSSFIGSFFLLFVMLILTSSGIYLIEQDVQPDKFGSIPAAMWWAMATLTTVGYGDVTPVTALGKFFGGCITIIGVGLVALPAGILASGFSEQMRRRREAFAAELAEAMQDGVITAAEESELEALRKQLGIRSDDVARLLHAYARDNQELADQCPHCGGHLIAAHAAPATQQQPALQ